MNSAANAKGYEEVKAAIGEPVENTIRHFANDFIKANADFHERAGLNPQITRYSRGDSKVCAWCQGLTSNGDYGTRPDDLFRRHNYCRCIVLYKPDKRSLRSQNAHTKKWNVAGKNDIQQAIQVKRGKKSSIAKAASGANPNYAKGGGYKTNCRQCAIVYELRRRGYDVIAKASKGGRMADVVNLLKNITTGTPPVVSAFSTTTAFKRYMGNQPDGSRHGISVSWNKKNGHVFVAEKIKGVVHYIDPQNGNMNVSSYFAKRSKTNKNIRTFRMDDCDMDHLGIKQIVEVSK
jgi:hypothetical protein